MSGTSEKIRQIVPNPMAYLKTVISLDEDTKHDKLDRMITKILPVFVAICSLFSILLIIYLKNFTLAGILFGLCLGFVIGFILLGVACFILSDRGVIALRYVILILAVVPALVGCLLYMIGSDIGFNEFIVKYFDIFGRNTGLVSLVVSAYSLTLMIFFVAYGVVSVIVGYFRSYFHRVLKALEYPPDRRKNHIPEWLFQIPDIIDIVSVEFEPDADDGKFNIELFRNTALSLFMLGIVICSYIFINPLFLQIMPFEDMLLLGIMLSLFISPLVIPWSIVKSIGAKVTSDAPRDFYLWKGMRGRLYQGFFAITFFMMLLTLSVYLGMDFSRIAATYLGYVTFMGITSLITSFVYVNVYYRGFKNGIIKSYLFAKDR
ncbi:MAG: hypothetical protein LBJ20_01550 [Candidatus Methanoplasma sp.]|jgi:hypothetical protein|nr:hypothetical protein [Candidatus Methanoplasma sp.]